MSRALCIGECMAELSPQGEGYRLGFAGDTFNTAWYLARLGVPVAYLSAVGDDALSGRMLEAMRAGGVGTDHVAVRPGRTVGLYLISLAEGERSFSYWRGEAAARQLADDPARLDAAMAEADLLYLSGITLAILSPAARDRLMTALGRAKGRGATIAFDPNLRPRLWPEAATMTAAVMDCAALADIALPSHEDEATWFGDADPEATRARYAGAGVRTVVVKDGAGAVLWRDGAETGRCPVAPVAEIVDTTAAGDSFNAGFLSARATGRPMQDAVRQGCALARQVVRGPGALVPVVA